jgi:hypothetical protein
VTYEPRPLGELGLDEARVLLEAHREEFLSEYRRQFPEWERAGVECLADFEKEAAE